MSKIKIAVDGASGAANSQLLEQYPDISVLNIPVSLKGKEYDSEAPEVFYKDVENSEEVPTTSQPSPGDILRLVEEAEKDGYTDILFITLSSGISGTFATSKTIPSLIEGNIKFHSFDSMTASANQLELTITAARMASEGKTVEEIMVVLEEMRNTLFSFFLVDDLKFLIKNGRLKGASALVGNLLKIKPILSMEKNVKGEIHAYAKVRSSKRAAKELVSIFLEELGDKKPKVIHLLHARLGETYDVVLNELKLQKPGYEKLVVPVRLPNLIVSHVGTSIYCLQYINQK